MCVYCSENKGCDFFHYQHKGFVYGDQDYYHYCNQEDYYCYHQKDYYQDSRCSHVKHQFKTGAFQINDELVSIGFSSEKQLLTAYIKKHGKSDTSRLDTTAWVTILLLHYYRLLAIDHQTEWQAQYEISYRWLWSQFKGKESVEKEAFALISSFVTEYYVVDEQTHKDDVQFVSKFEEKRKAIREGKTLVISDGKSTAGKLIIVLIFLEFNNCC